MTVLEYPNGQARGRAVPTHQTYTFKDSGVTVQLRKMSPMTVQHLNRAIERECKALPKDHEHVYPKPPVQEVAVGGGKPTKQENPSDPDYLRVLKAWQAWASNEIADRLIRLTAVEYLIADPELVRDEAARMRRILERAGMPLDEGGLDAYNDEEKDRIIYLIHVCFGSGEDMQEFSAYLVNRAAPSEAQITEATATFRPAGE